MGSGWDFFPKIWYARGGDYLVSHWEWVSDLQFLSTPFYFNCPICSSAKINFRKMKKFLRTAKINFREKH